MTLYKELDITLRLYIEEINYIKDFISSTQKSLEKKSKIKPVLSKDEKQQIRDVVKMINDGLKSKKKGEAKLEVSDNVSDFLKAWMKDLKQSGFLTEMTLSYLLSHQEAFLKDYVFKILINKSNMLKSNNKITYDDILEYTSMKALIKSLAQKEVDNLGYGSIDDAKEYFINKMNIDLSSFHKWEQVRESNYRRNIIIHNKGKTNELYCKKTGFKQTNKRIDTGYTYVIETADNLIEFIRYIHKCIVDKFNLKQRKRLKT